MYNNYIIDTLDLFRLYFQKSNLLYQSKKFLKIREFKNIHKGQRCFIVGTAPSLTISDLDLIKGELSFSVNSIVKILDKTEWRPTYYGIQDMHVYEKIEKDVINANLPYCFVGHRLYSKFKSAQGFIPYFLYNCRHSSHGELMPLSSNVSNDVSKVVYDGYSIVHSLIQIAIYMGFHEIYIIGCDCSYDINGSHHFVESGFFDKQAATVGERMIYAHKIAKEYADKNGVQIFNCTRGGMLEVYERVNLESLFNRDNYTS